MRGIDHFVERGIEPSSPVPSALVSELMPISASSSDAEIAITRHRPPRMSPGLLNALTRGSEGRRRERQSARNTPFRPTRHRSAPAAPVGAKNSHYAQTAAYVPLLDALTEALIQASASSQAIIEPSSSAPATSVGAKYTISWEACAELTIFVERGNSHYAPQATAYVSWFTQRAHRGSEGRRRER